MPDPQNEEEFSQPSAEFRLCAFNHPDFVGWVFG
jgi:hypothetical protein